MISVSFSFHAYISSSLWDTALSYNVHPQCSPTCDNSCRPSSKDALFFYQHSVNLARMFDNENYTITSRQAVTTEISLKILNTTVPLPYRCQPTPPTSTTTKDNLFYVQESLGMENLSVIATTSNLNSILGEVKDQTVGLEISKVCLYQIIYVLQTLYWYNLSLVHTHKSHIYHIHTHTHKCTHMKNNTRALYSWFC